MSSYITKTKTLTIYHSTNMIGGPNVITHIQINITHTNIYIYIYTHTYTYVYIQLEYKIKSWWKMSKNKTHINKIYFHLSHMLLNISTMESVSVDLGLLLWASGCCPDFQRWGWNWKDQNELEIKTSCNCQGLLRGSYWQKQQAKE